LAHIAKMTALEQDTVNGSVGVSLSVCVCVNVLKLSYR